MEVFKKLRPGEPVTLETAQQHVLCNSFAFGGNDSSLLISNTRDHE